MLIFLSRPPSTLMAVTVACFLVACGRGESRQSTQPIAPDAGVKSGQTGQTGQASQAGQSNSRGEPSPAAKDMSITAAVKTRLAGDTGLSAFDIQVQTREGRVLLRGITSNSDARRHAAELARSVIGVVEVTNDLSVQVMQR